MCFRGRLEVILSRMRNECPEGGLCLIELGIGGNYDFFHAEPVFKIGSLDLCTTETAFRYREI